MNRTPKYTAGMFKKKMPRFGASSIRMPRMPKPRVKKFAEGGDMDDLVPRGMLPDENAAELAARARGSKGPSKRFRNRPSSPVIEEEVIVTPESYYNSLSPEEKKKMKEKYDKKITEQKRLEEERKRLEEARKRAFSRNVQTARTGGAIKAKKYVRGGGIETKGKTRGRFV